MIVLEIALDPFWAELSLIHGKILPGLKTDDVVLFDLELDAALHAAKAAVSLDQTVRKRVLLAPHGHRFGMGAVARNEDFFRYW
jgi:hypothetical protein